jgi:hypothetical protein
VSAWGDDLTLEYLRRIAAIDAAPRRRKGQARVTIVVVHRSRSGTWRTKRKEPRPGDAGKQKETTT